jgi:uncharacterized protein
VNLAIEHRVPRPRDLVFRALADVAGLAARFPTVTRFEATGPGEFYVLLRIPQSPSAGNVVVSVAILEQNDPESFWIRAEAYGEAGSIRGDAWVSLEEEDDGTRVRIAANLELEGDLASAGRSRIAASAREALSDLYDAIAWKIAESGAEADDDRSPFERVRAYLARIAGFAARFEPGAPAGGRNA